MLLRGAYKFFRNIPAQHALATPHTPQLLPTYAPLPVILLLPVYFIETPSRLPQNPPQVPFVDCPCCVPELFEMGGDIDCDFKVSAAPIPTPVDEPAPTAAPVTKSPTIAPDDSGGNNGNNGNRNVPVDVQTPAPPAMATTSPPTVPPVRGVSELKCLLGAVPYLFSSAHEELNQCSHPKHAFEGRRTRLRRWAFAQPD